MAKQRIIKSILKKREKLDHLKQDIIVTKIILLGLPISLGFFNEPQVKKAQSF